MGATLTGAVRGFIDEYAFLSNFHPCLIEYEGIEYPSTEHAYQAAKTLDCGERESIAVLATPGQSKRAGRRVTLRDDWEEVKVSVMRDLLIKKFSQLELGKKLIDTDDMYLEETNWWGDCFWGVCNGRGQNHLGRLLMLVRDEIKAAK